jgi:hypothetical protein
MRAISIDNGTQESNQQRRKKPLIEEREQTPRSMILGEMILDRQFVFRHIAEYLVQAWDVRYTCKHSGAVLPFPSAPVGRGVDGIYAMA